MPSFKYYAEDSIFTIIELGSLRYMTEGVFFSFLCHVERVVQFPTSHHHSFSCHVLDCFLPRQPSLSCIFLSFCASTKEANENGFPFVTFLKCNWLIMWEGGARKLSCHMLKTMAQLILIPILSDSTGESIFNTISIQLQLGHEEKGLGIFLICMICFYFKKEVALIKVTNL